MGGFNKKNLKFNVFILSPIAKDNPNIYIYITSIKHFFS